MSIRLRQLPFVLPAVLLVAVAGWQAIRVQTHEQSPWLGGGFAMFSYVDSESYRPLVAVAADDPDVAISIPARLRREAERLVAAPTDDRAERFAVSLSVAAERPVRVEVWRPVFEPESLVVAAELIAAGVGSAP